MSDAHPFLQWVARVEAGESLTIVPPQHRALIAYALEERAHQAKMTKHAPRRGGMIGPRAPKGQRHRSADLLARLRQVWRELHRRPHARELPRLGLPAASTYGRHFGTYQRACELARPHHE